MKTKYLTSKHIEGAANSLISQYEQRYGSICAPVNVERIAENIIDLVLEWNKIPEDPCEVIFAGLNPMQKKIIFNERRRKSFDDYAGLYNTVLAHEIGHWVLHIDAVDLGLQPVLLETQLITRFVYRSTGPTKPIEWQAHEFMGYLLLPHKLLRNHIETGASYDWDSLYYLRDKFDVTISALVMRLRRMGLIYIEDKTIYPSIAIAKGQMRMV